MNQRFSLYHLPYCPFCLKVRAEAERLGIELDLIDVSVDPRARAKLLEQRGRATVPVLGIPTAMGERLMGESADIVKYLQANAASFEAA